MIIGVPKEIKPQENRIGTVPAMVHALRQAGHEVLVQAGGGLGCGIEDEAFAEAGARIVPDADAPGCNSFESQSAQTGDCDDADAGNSGLPQVRALAQDAASLSRALGFCGIGPLCRRCRSRNVRKPSNLRRRWRFRLAPRRCALRAAK